MLAYLDSQQLEGPLADGAKLLAKVLGQDLEENEDGVFRIARRVAPDRVISTVDPEARHGHKTSARGFDGYKGSVALDPDSEIITDTEVSAANVGDASVAADLIDDLTGGEDSDGSGDDASQNDDLTVPDSSGGTATSKPKRAGGGKGGRTAKQATGWQGRRPTRPGNTGRRPAGQCPGPPSASSRSPAPPEGVWGRRLWQRGVLGLSGPSRYRQPLQDPAAGRSWRAL